MELGKVLLEAEKEATKSLWAPLVLLFHTVLFHTVLWRTTVTLELPTSAPLFGQILAPLSFHHKWTGDNNYGWIFCLVYIVDLQLSSSGLARHGGALE